MASTGRARRSRTTRITWLLCGSVLLLALVWTLVSAGLAWHWARAAEVNLRAGAAAAREADLASADRRLTAAGDDLHRASQAAGQPPLRLLARVPLLGPHLQALQVTTEAGDLLVNDAARPLVTAGREALDSGAGLASLSGLARPAGGAASAAEESGRLIRSVPADSLRVGSSRFRSVQSTLGQASDLVYRGATLAEAAPDLIGDSQPRRYLVVVQDLSRERPTGGRFGSWVELQLDHGSLSLAGAGSAADLDAIVPSDQFESSPDFSRAAQVIAQGWQQQRGTDLDGVIAVTSKVLGAGPLPGSTSGSAPVPGLGAGLAAAGQLLRLQNLGPSELISTIGTATRSGDLQAWFENPQAATALAGTAGALPAPTPEHVRFYLTGTDDSARGQYVYPRVSTSCADSRSRTTIALRYSPPSELTDPHTLSLALYLPPRQQPRLTVDGTAVTPQWDTEKGWAVARLPLTLQPGATSTVEVELAGTGDRPKVVTQPLTHRTALPAAARCG